MNHSKGDVMGFQIVRSIIIILLLIVSGARADELVRNSIPEKWILPFLPEDLPELHYPSYFNDFDKAKMQSAAGRYKLSLITLRKVQQADPIQMALVKAASQIAMGRYSETIETLSKPAVVDDSQIQVARANVLAKQGQLDEAITLLKEHLNQYPDSLPGHYYLGSISEQAGDLENAKQAYEWFVIEPQRYLDKWQGLKDKAFEDAAEVTILGRALDRWAMLNSMSDPALHNTILNMFVRAYDVIDRGYVPAHAAAAAYFMAHDDRGQAKQELAKALAGNPNDPEALELVGRIAIVEHNFPAALEQVDALRKIDPDSVAADMLELRALLRGDRGGRATAIVQRLLTKRPAHLEALGLAAAEAAIRLDQAARDQYLSQADAIAPDSATALGVLAEVMQGANQYEAAQRYCAAAIERNPQWPAPRHQLGLLHMRLAEEEEARAAFEAAYQLDPFNVATVNYLRLLDDMESFERVKTAHFVITYDPRFDPVLAEYLGEYMEQVYVEVCRDFKHEPARTTVLEIFPTTDSFSVRTAGVPGAETYGASFGPVITAVAPRAGATLGPFNFARVLRHEFTHVINMAATDQRCPRWLTEGLATWQEGVPFRFDWVPPVLHERAANGKLFPIAQMSQSLLRPPRPQDGEILYMQAFWIVRYMDETFGRDAIIKLLDAFKQGKTEDEAFRHAVNQPLAEFQTAFFAWAKQQVSSWGYDDATAKHYNEIVKQAEEKIKSSQLEEAVELWRKAHELQPMNTLPRRRLAGLYLSERINRPEEAIPHLEILHHVELKDNRYAKRITRLYRDLEQFDKAAHYAMQSIYIDPYDVNAHELLAEIYEKTGDESGLTRERRVLEILAKQAEKK